MNIYEKLQLSRIKLQSMNLKKSGKNKFAGFAYYELSDFMPKINEIFCELKLYSMFFLKDNDAILEIVNSEKPEEHVAFTSPTASVDLKGCTAIQAIGAIHTYMRRYLYMSALEIVESDALDASVGADDDIKKNKTNIEKSIDAVANIEQLNNMYVYLKNNAKNDDWKPLLNKKALNINAIFDKGSNQFSTC